MQFELSFDDDEVARDAAGEASVRFWDDVPGHATSKSTRIGWVGPHRRRETEVVRRHIEATEAMELVQALAWTQQSDDLTLGDLWVRWW